MLFKLFLFEWKYQWKQTSYKLFTILFILAGVYFGMQEGAIKINHAYNNHLFTSLISLFAIFQVVFLMANTMLRDSTYHTKQLIHSTSIKKSYFLLSRFIGVLIPVLLSTLGYVVFLYLSVLIDILGIYDGVPNFKYFIWPWFIIVLPNVFVLCSLTFLTAILTRKTAMVFFMGLLVFVGFWVNNFQIGSPFTGGKLAVVEEKVILASKLDILGMCASYGQTQFWSPLEKSSLLMPFSYLILTNRLLVLALAIILIVIGYLVFSFKLKNEQRKKSTFPRFFSRKKHNIQHNVPSYGAVIPIKHSFKARWREFLTLLKVDLKTTVFTKVFALIVIIWVIMILSAILSNLNGQDVYGNILPYTGLLAGIILEPLRYIGLFLIVFYSGELVWKAKQYQFNELLNVTPISNATLLASKYIALLLLPSILIVLSIGISLLVQVLKGYTDINFLLYESILYYGGSSLLIYTIICVLVHQWVANKYVGMLLSIIVIYGAGFILPTVDFHHPMAQLFQLPKIGEGFSDFVGFGNMAHLFQWMTALWFPVTAMLALITYKLYNRNIEVRFKDNIQALRMGWKKPQQFLLAILLLCFCVSATIIDRNVDVTSDDVLVRFRESYEKQYKYLENYPIPYVIDIQTEVALFPKEQRYEVKGIYMLKNTNKKPIDTLLVTGKIPFESFKIEGTKTIAKDTSLLESRLVVFTPPLQPEETKKMEFKVSKRVGDFELQKDILSNGTYLRNSSFEPQLGYQTALEIVSKYERNKRNLSEITIRDTDQTMTKPLQNFETWVTTDSNQRAIAPGVLKDTAITDHRTTYHYKTARKVDNNISYFSATYTSTVIQHRGISLEVYYLPQHSKNVPDIIAAAKATIDYGSDHFGSYPFDHLRFAEVPSHWKFGGHALPGTIAFQERFFLQDTSNPTKGINQLSRVVIHEIAHQWFGHKMSPAPGKGANMLTETMAVYVEAQVLENMYGKTMVRRLANFSRRRYFKFRSSAEAQEPSLHQMKQETYIAYRKGFVVMQALEQLLGEEPLNEILRKFINNNQEQQTATASDFLLELEMLCTKEKYALISDWFEKRTIYDISISDVSYSKNSTGGYDISIKVNSRKFELSPDGIETEIPLDEKITIGLYTKYPDDTEAKPTFKKASISGTTNTIEFTVKKLPKYILIDPMVTRLDKNVLDNLKQLEL